MIRIGVFVDGGTFQQIDTHYRDHHPRASGIRPGGLVDWCRDHVARRTGRDLGLCRVAEAWCFTSAGGDGPNERVPFDRLRAGFRRDGFVTLDVGGGLRGAEVALSVEALHRTMLGLDVVILVVSSTAYVPLVRKLAAAGAVVLIPGFQLLVPDRKGDVRRQWTSPALLEEAAWPVVLSRVIDQAEDRDPLVRGLFITGPRTREAEPRQAERVSQGEMRETRAAEAPPLEEAPEGRLSGRVADLRERMGFIVEDWNGKRLFFHFSAVAEGGFLDLEVGDRVEYDRGLDPRNRPAATAVAKVGGVEETEPALEPEPESAARPIIGTPTEPNLAAVTQDTEPAMEAVGNRGVDAPPTVEQEQEQEQENEHEHGSES
ncbi:MAG: cold shock domain-containing protein [Pseudomonadota bacterium]